nr:MAG TPA: hypothetical protein [Caudoviricetes sp.]
MPLFYKMSQWFLMQELDFIFTINRTVYNSSTIN